MIFRFNLRWIRITLTIAPVTKVIGVNSKLPDGKHILMWDFDDTTLLNVVFALGLVQRRYKLPDIYIFESSPKHYIAYCFKRMNWRKAVEIIAATPGVDWNFLKY